MQELQHLPKDSAGRLLTTRVPTAGPEEHAGAVRHYLEQHVKEFDTINYIYLLNHARHLVGVVSLRELLQAPVHAAVATLSPKTVVTVRPHTDQERVVYLAIRSRLKAVPVVDSQHRFLGAVSSDVILETLYQEHTEDWLYAAGVSKSQDPVRHLLGGSVLSHIYTRLPWLILGLAGGMVAALVVEWFDEALRTELILAAFIPAIVYMADAVGSQAQMLFVRALTVMPDLNVRQYLVRELWVNVQLGMILSGLLYGVTWLWYGNPAISFILGVALFCTVAVTMVIAVALPWLFDRQGYDPAIASGPLATVVCDILSLGIYFLVATALL